MNNQMDAHKEIQQQLSAYFDGELETSATLVVKKHLLNCDECQQIIADFEVQQGLMYGLKQEDPIDTWSQIRDQIEIQEGNLPLWKRWVFPLPVVALVATLVFGLVVFYPISERSSVNPINDYLSAHAQYSTDYSMGSSFLNETVSAIELDNTDSLGDTDWLLDAYHGYE
jgi:predicted anti-sigma-YlaC factor YlaD